MYISLFVVVNTFIRGRQTQNKLMRLRTFKNLSNQSLYRVLSLLALLQDSFTETRDEQCVCGIRDEHTCSLYLIH